VQALEEPFGAAALFILIGSLGAHAQGGSGSIEGRVSDNQQVALPPPVVEFEDAQGHTIQKVVGHDTGRYQFSSVPPGSYTVQFGRSA
jgi:hypothetical protein